jgi:hypothetical protein
MQLDSRSWIAMKIARQTCLFDAEGDGLGAGVIQSGNPMGSSHHGMGHREEKGKTDRYWIRIWGAVAGSGMLIGRVFIASFASLT